MKPNSLRLRILFVAGLILIVFMGITGFVLDSAHRQTTLLNIKSRLGSGIDDLMRAYDSSQQSGSLIDQALIDHRLLIPDSGYYAQVVDGEGKVLWQSPSMAGKNIAFDLPTRYGSRSFTQLTASNQETYFSMNIRVIWENASGESTDLSFGLTEDETSYLSEIREFQHAISLWLGTLIIVLLFVQSAILNWGLAPLRRISREITAIESGDQQSLIGAYPIELMSLANHLNAFIEQAHKRQSRYRNAMADLAHSLKTPLAVIRAILQSEQSDSINQQERSLIQVQLARLDEITVYQLNRAAAVGKANMAKPVQVRELIEKIVFALKKVYQGKHLHFSVDVADSILFYGDETDLLECLGNVLDNACKYGRTQIIIDAKMTSSQTFHQLLQISIADDGDGIDEAKIAELTERGVQADTRQEGHGFGLSLVEDIVNLYQGDMRLTNRPEGGTKVVLCFPR